MTPGPAPPGDLPALAGLSARIGSNPLLVQAAGGNTSVKDGGVMWIKASGTLLADALDRDVFVPVDLPAARAALDDPGVDADQAARFALGAGGLRPSIETSLHAVFEQRVVVHVHCVSTLAHAVRRDAAARLADRMDGFDWRLVPYAKPGASLAEQVRARLGAGTDVAVLANHGLIVAAGGVAEAGALLDRVTAALDAPPGPARAVDTAGLAALPAPGWDVPPAGAAAHQLALDEARLAQATGGSLYPDHVVYCGVGAVAAAGVPPPAAGAPPFVLVPGRGVLAKTDASPGALALMNCLGDVLSRVGPGADLAYLTPEQNAELLDWDAEKYRQALDA